MGKERGARLPVADTVAPLMINYCGLPFSSVGRQMFSALPCCSLSVHAHWPSSRSHVEQNCPEVLLFAWTWPLARQLRRVAGAALCSRSRPQMGICCARGVLRRHAGMDRAGRVTAVLRKRLLQTGFNGQGRRGQNGIAIPVSRVAGKSKV